ncbi:T9SS type A sorting domain-containing protein [candidate division KSB1 bacterium]|nr:T9SS type A sorting domain-containing protein [candidate division KSB1 bacterium]
MDNKKNNGFFNAIFISSLLLILYTFVYPQTFQGKIGINLGQLEWVDVMKGTSRYQKLTSSEQLGAGDLDDNLWPTCDFKVIVMDNRPVAEWSGSIDDPEVYRIDYSGTYKASFTGQASVTSWWGQFFIQNKNYDEGNNTTTFDIVVGKPGPNHGTIALNFSSTKRTPQHPANSGITNLKVLRPDYDINYDRPFADILYKTLTYASFSTIRAMGLTATPLNIMNGQTVFPDTIGWTNRKQLDDASYDGFGDKPDGAPWEIFIDLCNEVKMDMWINIPAAATDHYIRNLAKLIYNRLDPQINVYVENDNEVWGFEEQRYYNQAQAAALGLSDVENYARMSMDAGIIFNEVFGGNELNKRIRVVLQWTTNQWLGGVLELDDMLEFVNQRYGAPGDYVYGIGISFYFSSEAYSGEWPYASVIDILQSLKPGIENSLDDRRTVVEISQKWNLPTGAVSYEGGQSYPATGEMNYLDNRITACRDKSMAALTRYNLEDYFFGLGGTLACHFTLAGKYTRYGCWGLTDDMNDPDRNSQFLAVRELLDDVDTPQPPIHFYATKDPESGAVALYWDDIADDEDGFIIERNSGNGTYVQIASVNANDTSYTEKLSEEGAYTYRMYAFNVNGNSSTSFVSSTILIDYTPPAAPQNLDTLQVWNNKVKLVWNPATDNNPGEPGYEIFMDGELIYTTTGTERTVTRLKPGVVYRFQVRARDIVGNVSAFSNTLTVMTVSPSWVKVDDADARWQTNAVRWDPTDVGMPVAWGGTVLKLSDPSIPHFAEITVYGTKVRLFGHTYPAFEGGQLLAGDIYIDGQLAAQSVSWESETVQVNALIYETEPLEAGEHTIRLVTRGDFINIDYLAVESATAVYSQKDKIPAAFGLEQNYPNPFNPVTEIEFRLPQAGFVLLDVFNIVGEKVMTLVEKPLPAGYYKALLDGSKISSGIYYYRLRTGEFEKMKKCLLLK